MEHIDRTRTVYILNTFGVHVIKKTPKTFSGRIRTHDLLLTSADILTNSTTEFAGGEWPIRILYSSGYHNE